MDKEYLLKLADNLEALSGSDLSNTSLINIYNEIKKYAEQNINDDDLFSYVKLAIDSMKDYRI